MPHIVVVGSSNTDMVVKSDHIPVPGETVTGGQFVLAQGGKGANQAVAAARLGAKVTFIAAVGNDVFGQQAIEHYQHEQIDTSYITQLEEYATGVALILVDEKGENLISVASGANHQLTPERIDEVREVIEQADMVVLQLEIPLTTIERVTQIAAAKNIPIILDPAPAPLKALPESLMKNLFCIKPNETEAFRLTGIEVDGPISAQKAADVLLTAGAALVIITLGTQGAYLTNVLGKGTLIPARMVKAVDSTAAGDAFSGALAFALAQGQLAEDAAKFASNAAALSVMKLGAQPSLPTMKNVLDFNQC